MSTDRTCKWLICTLATAMVVFLTFGMAPALRAQSTLAGAIGGTVTDPSGGVVASATVTIHNNDTNAEQTIMTDSMGYYRLAELSPGTYTVTVTATGFAAFKAQQVLVTVGAVTDLSPKLAVASAGQTVVVNATTPQINTTSSDFAPLVNNTAIAELPIQRPRWSSFALLTPGVVSDSNGFGLLSFRGISTLLNNNTVDGADNNQAFFAEERGRTRISYSSSSVMIQEFQVNTSNYSAEYGRAAGGVVNTVTKSGTNNFHGEGFFFRRENDWGARNPFALVSLPGPTGFVSTPVKPTDWWNRAGFGVGGPIIKDKLFFFVAYDYFNRNFPGTAVASSPASFFAAPTSTQINTLISNLGGTTTSNTALYNADLAAMSSGLLGPVPRTGNQDIFFPKIDWQINQNNHFSIEANRMRWGSPAGIQTQVTNSNAVASFGNDYVWDTWGVARLNTTVSATMINEARVQIGRDFEFENSQPPTAYETQNLLTNALTAPGYSNPLLFPPQVTVTNGFTFGTPTFLERPKYPDELREQFADTVTWTHGSHIFKFGFDYSHVNDDAENLSTQYGSYSYSNLQNYFSDLTKPNSCAGKQCFTSYGQAFGPLGFKFATNDIALFAEDNWRVMPRLTLTLGLRWEDELLPSPQVPNPAVPETTKFPSNNHQFGPRVGVAYDIFGDGKTSFRAGYGVYYGRTINSNIFSAIAQTGVPGAQLSYSFNAGQAGAPTFPQILTATPTASIQPAILFFDPGYRAPMIQETDASLERQVGWDTVVSVSYLGSYGRNLPAFIDTNLAPATSTLTYSVQGGGPLKVNSVSTPLYTTRPNASYAQMIDILGVSTNYNALALQVNHRMNRNIQVTANYTFAHALDYGENANTTYTASFGSSVLDPQNIKQEYGNSIFNVPNRFVLSAVIQSPWHAKDKWMGYLVDGWQLAPVFTLQNGLPYSAKTSGTAPGAVRSGGGYNGSDGDFRIIDLGRDTFRQAGIQNLDLRLSKNFVIREGYTLVLLGEVFNLANHYNITGVNTTAYFVTAPAPPTAPTLIVNSAGATVACTNTTPCLTFNAPFGTATSANSNFVNSTRQIQVGVRFLF